MSGDVHDDAVDGALLSVPPIDDDLLLTLLTGSDRDSLPLDAPTLLDLISRHCSPRVVATMALALHLREETPVPLRALVVIARDLLSAETDQSVEAVAGLVRAGWYGGTGELLSTARSL